MSSPLIVPYDRALAGGPVYYKKFTARNFNTSPLTISGLKGDTYDYTLMIWGISLGAVANLILYPNSDTTTNYRLYQMAGGSTTASALVSDSWSVGIFFDLGWGASTANLAICNISGSSGDERYFDSFYSCGHTTRYIRKASQYWKNTADEVTSLQIKGSVNTTYDATIAVFATPKDISENWSLLKTLSWSAETAEKSFSGLPGDSDIQYLLRWRGDQELNVELNNDNATNYTRQYAQNSGGTISAANSTTDTSIVSDGTVSNILINAETGRERLSLVSSSNTSAAQQSERGVWYSDTATEVTSIDCTPTASATGTAELWKKKNPGTIADRFNLPFKQLKKVAVSGDFSAGYTFSGLTSDKVLMYKIEFIGDGDGVSRTNANDLYLRMQFNADNGPNYSRQHFRSYSSSADANSGTDNHFEFFNTSIGGLENEGEFCCYLFPKSGENRPVLYRSSVDYGSNYLVNHGAGWWNNTVNEITSIKVFANQTYPITVTLKLSYIPLPEA